MTGDPSDRDTGDVDELDVVLIAAVAENGVIGDDGGMPWHHPEDLQHFKETTMGHPVVLGRRTFESIVDRIDGPLPGRTNVVLSRSMEASEFEETVVVGGIDEALAAAAETGADTIYVAGGATVYEAFLERDLADRMILTELEVPHDGDTYFPEWPPGERWTERDRDEREELAFVVYGR